MSRTIGKIRGSAPALFLSVLLISTPFSVEGFDGAFEGRLKAGSVYIPDAPPGFKDFDSEVELHLGVLGNAWKGERWQFDYELSADAKQADGPSEQASLSKETDTDLHRAWLRLSDGRWEVRGGRQKIDFGSGFIYRPLSFFNTRDVTGVVPETRGVDGVRSTYFINDTTSVQGWVVPAKAGERVIAGLRWEGLLGEVESGWVAQYHPESDLSDLPQFGQELIQFGYHFKGEYAVGYWTEGRVDVERINGRHPLRFDSVLGTDFTFDVGDGLHVLIEYFFSTREPQFTQEEALKGDRTLHQFGVLFDQPVGADITWQTFGLFDGRDGSFQIIPQVEYALTSEVFLYLSGRWGGTLKTDRRNGRLFEETETFSGTEPNVGLTVVGYF